MTAILSDKARQCWKRFWLTTRGDTAIIFALSLIPMLLASGMAFDYSRAIAFKTRLQSALDAGALAAAASTRLSDAERTKLATASFNENIGAFAAELKVRPTVTITGDKVSMSADVNYPTSFLRIVGVDAISVGNSVDVVLPGSKKAEVALALDYSRSMTEVSGGKVKYVAMREAAIKLIDDLSDNGTSKRVKFGLVPFSHQVYASLPGEDVVGGTAGKTWTGCTEDRQYPFNLTGEAPVAGNNASKWGQSMAKAHASKGCWGYAPRNLVVRPVSDDFSALKGQLQSMRPYAFTHIALGFAMGWQLLSPDGAFGNTVAYDDPDTMKVLVLLTDGRQTEPAFGPGKGRSTSQGEANLETECSNAKAKGITVITLAFDLRNAATRNRLRNCSSDPDRYFFIAEDDAQLASAFERIKATLKTAIYISK